MSCSRSSWSAAGRSTTSTRPQGASTAVFAATSPRLDSYGGTYLKDNEISLLDQPTPINFTDHDVPSYVVPHALDAGSAERLWTLSEDLIKH
jgi:hypothetical protein